jgi:hypothetical protein
MYPYRLSAKRFSLVLLSWLFITFLLFSFHQNSAHAQAQRYSPHFHMLLSFVNQFYLRPNGWSPPQFAKEHPDNVALILGHALRQQMKAAQESTMLFNRYQTLENEARDYLDRLSQSLGYRFSNGRQMIQGELWGYAIAAINGRYDNDIYQHFGVANNQLPIVLWQPPQQLQTALQGTLQGEMAIELLRVVATQAHSPGLIPGQTVPQTANPATQSGSQRTKQPIGVGAILGRWQSTGKGCAYFGSPATERINYFYHFSRGNDRDIYIGRSTEGDLFSIISENKEDPYKIRYTAIWRKSNQQLSNYVEGKELEFIVYRGKNNELLMCRNDCYVVVNQLFIKVDQ